MVNAALTLITAFVLTVVIMPAVIALSKKLKIRQTVLHYVDNHASKSGTPTMGGIAFIIAAAVSPLFFMNENNSLLILTVFVMLGYGIIGFLDDFIKIFFKQNKGLSPWQKIVFQVLIAVIVSIYAYYNRHILDIVYAPFTLKELPLGFFAIPFYIFIFLAFTNAVNLTDGLDGLAGKVTGVYSVIIFALIAIVIYALGDGQAFKPEYSNLLLFCAGLTGALIGFLCFNGFPAKIFMGDTGSLALGGALAALAVVTRLSLYVPMIGIMYVLTSVSVILQVLHYKRTKKRIFLMAPLHHHFERKGIHENRIVTVYSAVTLIMGLVAAALTAGLSM